MLRQRFSFTLIMNFLLMAIIQTSMTGSALAQQRIYELRTYTAHADKFPLLLSRFRDHTVLLFEEHGMKNVAYWESIEPELGNQLIYILEHQNREAAKKSFQSFGQNPQWRAIKAESEKDGPLLSEPIRSLFLNQVAGSPEITAPLKDQLTVLRKYQANPDRRDELARAFTTKVIPVFTANHISVTGVFTADHPEDAPESVFVLFEFPSQEAGQQLVDQLIQQPQYQAVLNELTQSGILNDDTSSAIWLKTSDFSPVREAPTPENPQQPVE